MNADANRLRTGGLVAGIGGVVLILIMSIFSWYGVTDEFLDELGGPGATADGVNAWQAFGFTDILLLIAALLGIGLALLGRLREPRALPIDPMGASAAAAAMGGIMAMWILWRIINEPGPDDLIDVKAGAYLGVLALLAVAVGGWMAMRDLSAAHPGGQSAVGETHPTAQAEPAPSPEERQPGDAAPRHGP